LVRHKGKTILAQGPKPRWERAPREIKKISKTACAKKLKEWEKRGVIGELPI